MGGGKWKKWGRAGHSGHSRPEGTEENHRRQDNAGSIVEVMSCQLGSRMLGLGWGR